MKQLLVILLLALSSIFMPEQSFGQFKYPFSPEDKEWNSFPNANERKAALAIPNDSLKGIKTSELLTLCLDYPYLTDFYAYNSSEEGLNALMSEFNGFKELIGRQDLKPCLIDEVETVNKTLTSTKRTAIKDKGRYTLRFNVLLYMLERTLSTDSLTEVQSQQLRSAINSLAKIDVIQESIAFNAINQISQTLTARTSNDTYTIYGKSYSPQKKLTPNMYPVYAGKLTSADMSSDEKRSIRNDVITNYPGATVVDDATYQYNCHAYAWHMSQGNINDKVWIGFPATGKNPKSCPDPYWGTGSYYEVNESEASIVTYGTYGLITHSAIRLSSNEYLSKWGAWPLVRHSPTNVPSGYGRTYKYYKRYSPSIDGPTLFNTSATYSVSNLPSGYSVSWSFSEPDKLSSFNTNYPDNGQCALTRDQSQSIYNANLSANIRFAEYNVLSATKSVSSYSGFYGKYRINGGVYNQISTPPYFIFYPANCYLEITSPNLVDATVTTQGDAVLRSWNFDPISGYIKVGMPSYGNLIITINSSNGTSYIPVRPSSAARSIGISQANGEISISLPDIDNDENIIVDKSKHSDDYVMIQRLNTGKVLFYQPITDNVKAVGFPVNGNSGLYLIKVHYNGQEIVKKIAAY